MMKEPYPAIIVMGTPVDGFEFIGPFMSSEDAANYADKIDGGDWWITSLDAPEEGTTSTTGPIF